MEPVLTEHITDCGICGEVGCEQDLLYVTEDDVAVDLGVEVGAIVCRDCACVQ